MDYDYLARDDAPFSSELWQQIDAAVTEAARQNLVGRRFLSLYGALGPGALLTSIDSPARQETLEDGFGVMQGRLPVQLPILYEDFWLYWRDVAAAQREGVPLDLSAAVAAGQNMAFREDGMVFYGSKAAGIDGIFTASGTKTQKRGDWQSGENAFSDIAAAQAALLQGGKNGRHTLLLSQDLYVQLQRIQPGTGLLESERVSKLLEGQVYRSALLQNKTAALVCAQPQFIDIVVGQDIKTAYTEAVDLNHHLRVMETATIRIKDPTAIVLFK